MAEIKSRIALFTKDNMIKEESKMKKKRILQREGFLGVRSAISFS